MSDLARLTLKEIAESSNLPERTVRFYIREGLVSPALGRGRSAYYTTDHVLQLAQIAGWRQERRSLAEIRALLAAERQPMQPVYHAEQWQRVRLHDDLELHVRVGASEAIQRLAQRLAHEVEGLADHFDDEL